MRRERRFFLRRKLENSSNDSYADSVANSSLPMLGSKQKSPLTVPYFNGTFVQFGAVGLHKSNERGVRAILWTKNFTELWLKYICMHTYIHT